MKLQKKIKVLLFIITIIFILNAIGINKLFYRSNIERFSEEQKNNFFEKARRRREERKESEEEPKKKTVVSSGRKSIGPGNETEEDKQLRLKMQQYIKDKVLEHSEFRTMFTAEDKKLIKNPPSQLLSDIIDVYVKIKKQKKILQENYEKRRDKIIKKGYLNAINNADTDDEIKKKTKLRRKK